MRQFRCVYECWKVAVEIAKEQTVQLYCTVVKFTVYVYRVHVLYSRGVQYSCTVQ